jgi:hypothetical protein
MGLALGACGVGDGRLPGHLRDGRVNCAVCKTKKKGSIKKPLDKSAPVFDRIKKKISFVALMRNMPYLSRDIMSFCFRHELYKLYIDVFGLKNVNIGPEKPCSRYD